MGLRCPHKVLRHISCGEAQLYTLSTQASILIFHVGCAADVTFVMALNFPVSILYKCIAGCYRPVRVAGGPITIRFTSIKNAYWKIQGHNDGPL